MSSDPNASREPLTAVGAIDVSVAVTDDPLGIGADVVLIPASKGGLGSLGRSLARSIRWFDSIDSDGVLEEVTPSTPAWVDLERGSVRVGRSQRAVDQFPPDQGSVRALVLASPRADGAKLETTSLEAIGTSIRAAVVMCAENESRHLAMPVLGGGLAREGIPFEDLADTVVTALTSALRNLPPSSSLTQVSIFTKSRSEADAVHSAATEYEPQPLENDRVSGPDLLRLGDEVGAIADMLLLRQVKPPLVVGITGDWGSGKSFVMDMLRQHILARRAAILTEDECWEDSATPFVGHVYPIRLNAWTYSRADLWAALMQTVLTGLDEQFDVEQRLAKAGFDLRDGREWSKLIAMPREVRKLAVSEIVASRDGTVRDLPRAMVETYRKEQEELAKHKTELNEHRSSLEAREAELIEEAPARSADAWKTFRSQAAEVVGATADDVGRWVDDQLPGDMKLVETGTEAHASVRELRTALRNVKPPRKLFARRALRDHPMACIALVLLFVTAIVATVVAFKYQTALLAACASIVALVVPLLPIVRSLTSLSGRFTEALENWNEAVEQRAENARTEIVANDERANELRLSIANTERTIAEIKGSIGAIGVFTSVAALVQDRLVQGDYESRLGPMEQIRDDLASLSRSLTISDTDLYAIEKQKFFPRGPARVVLFIDDIDRLPPPKVVELLEAVELLVATELFVVVIGLDLRYVTKALEQVYDGVLVAGGDPSGLDYLEKIIQIPYRTGALSDEGARSFLAGNMQIEKPASISATAGPPGMAAGRVDTAVAASATSQLPSRRVVSRTLLFTARERNAVAACCAELELTPRATKRIANVLKIYRMVQARQGRPRPDENDVAALGLMLGLAAAHPEAQQRAMSVIEREIRTRPDSGDAFELLLSVDAPDASEQWRNSVGRIRNLALPDDPEDIDNQRSSVFDFGEMKIGAVAKVLRFAAVFSFIGGSELGDSVVGRDRLWRDEVARQP